MKNDFFEADYICECGAELRWETTGFNLFDESAVCPFCQRKIEIKKDKPKLKLIKGGRSDPK